MTFTTLPGVEPLQSEVLEALITEVRPLSGYVSAATTVNNSVTLVNAAGAAVAVEANATYRLDLYLQYSTNSTADFKFGWTFPTGLTMIFGFIGFNTSEAFTAGGGQIQTSVPTLGGPAANRVCHVFGHVITSSTAGTLQLQFAQNTMTGVNTSVDAGTLLVLQRLS